MVVSAVFTKRTAAKFYDAQNKMSELFYLAQLQGDSLTNQAEDENLTISEEIINTELKKVKIEYKDSIGVQHEKSFYIQIP